MISSNPWLFWTVLSLIPAMFLTIVIHELGHALTGAIAGFRVVACGIGVTQPLVRVRLWGVSFYLARPILLGLTLAVPKRLRSDRRTLAILFVGGAAANLVTGFVAWQLCRHDVDGTFLRVFAFLSIFQGIGNLIPFYSSKYRFPTDGLQILRCIRNTLAQEPAQSIISSDRVFALCKSLEAREGAAYYGRLLALHCAAMGDVQTAEETLDDPTLPAAERNTAAYSLDLLTRAALAVAKKAPNAEEVLTKAELECTEDEAGLGLKLLRAEHMMHAGENTRALVEEVLTIARTTGRHALATETEALLLLIDPKEDASREIDRLLSLSGAHRLHPMTAVKLLVSQAKHDFARGATDDAKKRMERAQRLLITTAQSITIPAIRSRVLAAGWARLREVLPIAEYTSVLEETIGRPIEVKGGGRFIRFAFFVLSLALLFSMLMTRQLIVRDDEPPMSGPRDMQMQERFDTNMAAEIERQLNTVQGLRNGDNTRALGMFEADLASSVSATEYRRGTNGRHASLVKALRDLQEYRIKYPGAVADPEVEEILKNALAGEEQER